MRTVSVQTGEEDKMPFTPDKTKASVQPSSSFTISPLRNPMDNESMETSISQRDNLARFVLELFFCNYHSPTQSTCALLSCSQSQLL